MCGFNCLVLSMHAIFTDTRKTTQKKRQYCPTQHNTHKFYNRLKVVSLSLFSSFDFSLLLALLSLCLQSIIHCDSFGGILTTTTTTTTKKRSDDDDDDE